MINKLMGLLKSSSSKEKNVKINRLAYVTNSTFKGNNYVDRFCKIRNSTIGKYSYIGFGSDFNHVEIGNYCSISSDVKMGLGKHPLEFFSSSPIFYSNNNPFGIKEAYFKFDDSPNKTIVGHDVWIGANVIVLDGIQIGNGAVIAAGAIVTRNVEPYEIVGGVPAKTIKKRFDDETINKLLESKWWLMSPNELKSKNFSLTNLKVSRE
ncbi:MULTISPECIES: CatB-related O-acetyltransferase [Staphylococcus]|uniref:CatB-related O-acetyltransferase n=1 Tax=Staphylococcus lugdunensis TaxID=28035 RepID=A0ABD4ECZ1_STALU|nr:MULTISPECIES: CatB-related O-acetyltransferase [Staphylococcus]ADC86478.1 Capsular polysaccharide synthesis enzyme Cap5H; O-acetyl transferase [Staphylococcus lugdunensis HKU09-01]AMG64137.1 antibiotic acetyltransferase [Staphylococcus lugdunensis]ARB76793.1 antibiotic acetyltransferase [Staphylococcus lugdunensis]ARJ08222.1 acetyltransferase [Staphylococcus lugdunensis]ARJ15315.1 acetyltransferase [Staphylococcus lugdunensis]